MSGHEKQISKATNCRSITWPERHVTWAGPGGGGGGGGGGGVGGRGRQRRIGAGIDKQIVVVDVVVVVDVGASFIVAPVSFFFFLFFLFRFPGASSSTSRQVRGGGSSEAKKKMLKKKWKTKERRGRGPRASTSIHNARVQADVVRTSRSFRCHRVALYSTWFHFNSIATNGGRFHRIFPPDFDLDPPNLPGFTGFLSPRNSPDFVLLLLLLLLLMLSNCIEFYAILPSFT